MISKREYKENPCKALSIPYWKAKDISVPPNMRIAHDSDFSIELLKDYNDKKFFRLIHYLKNVPAYDSDEVIMKVLSPARCEEIAGMINLSYAHSEISVSADYVKSWTTAKVYCPELWLGAFLDEKIIGSIICDFDSEVGEAIIEWLQVLPEYRGRGIASALTCKALRVMKSFAEFATVSGECDNVTNPERIYRRCGFEGEDVWHILSK